MYSFYDLGVTFDEKLSLLPYTESDIKLLRFVRHVQYCIREFKFEYASFAWCPDYAVHINALGKKSETLLEIYYFL